MSDEFKLPASRFPIIKYHDDGVGNAEIAGNSLHVTLPPMITGQDMWRVLHTPVPLYSRQTRPRTLWDRIVYRCLIWTHDKAESLWHWCYRQSQSYAPTLDNQSLVFVESKLYGYPISVHVVERKRDDPDLRG